MYNAFTLNSWISDMCAACPNVEALELRSMRIKDCDLWRSVVACPKLTSLILGPTCKLDALACASACLLDLFAPQLSHLTLCNGKPVVGSGDLVFMDASQTPGLFSSFILSGCLQHGGITSLAISTEGGYPTWGELPSFGGMPKLRTFEMDDCSDEWLGALARTSSVQQVYVHKNRNDDTFHRVVACLPSTHIVVVPPPASWRKLVLHTGSFDTSQLMSLPITGLRHFEVPSISFSIAPHINAAVAAVAARLLSITDLIVPRYEVSITHSANTRAELSAALEHVRHLAERLGSVSVELVSKSYRAAVSHSFAAAQLHVEQLEAAFGDFHKSSA
jgi:hypothetical protein